MNLIEYLTLAANGAKAGANMFLAQPPLAAALRMTGGLLDLAIKLLEHGVDEPVDHITRLVNLDAEMNAARAEVDAEADADQRGR